MSNSRNEADNKHFLITLNNDGEDEKLQADFAEWIKNRNGESEKPLPTIEARRVYGTEYASIDQVKDVISFINQYTSDIDEEENPIDLLHRVFTAAGEDFADGMYYVQQFFKSLIQYFLVPAHAAAFESVPRVTKKDLFHYLPALQEMFERFDQSKKVVALIQKVDLKINSYHQNPTGLHRIKQGIKDEMELEAFKKQQRKRAA